MNFTKQSEAFYKHCKLYHNTYETITKFPSNKYVISQVLLTCFNGALAVLTVLLNVAAIVTISRCSQLKEKLCYFLILVLSVADLAVGMVGLPLFTFALASELEGGPNCLVNIICIDLVFLTTGFSFTILLYISAERYLGILHPLIHRTKVTKKKLLFAISIGLCCNSTVWFLSSVHELIANLATAISVPVFLLEVIYVYTRIFLAARKTPILNSSNGVAGGNSMTTVMKHKAFLKEFKLAKSCFSMVLCYFFSFLPILIAVTSKYSAGENLSIVKWRIVHSWCVSIVMLNSSLNSVILFWQRPVLRKEAKKQIGKIIRLSSANL